jgi:DNA topoisomerase-2
VLGDDRSGIPGNERMAARKSKHAIEGRELEEAGVRQADAFVALSPRSQVLEKSGMWLGSSTPEASVMPCFDGTSIRRKEIPDFIEAVDRCVVELISNAIDNATYSIHCGRKPDEISVTVTDTRLTIVNGGSNVPVARMADGRWVPELLWGSLFTSSHYEESRKKYKQSTGSSGTNGVGGALVAIFSDTFDVIVEDPESRQRFKQTWCRGKPIEDDGVPRQPIVKKDRAITETMISVSWILNFPFFGIERYSPLMMEVIKYHAVTASFTAKVPVTIIDAEGVAVRYDVGLITDYAALYPELRISDSKKVEYYRLSEGTTVPYADAVKKHIELPRIEALIIDELADEPQEGEETKKGRRAVVRASSRKATGAFQLSFVNGIATSQGGVHVDEMIKAFFGAALAELKITIAQGKRHISFLLSVRVSDPKFREQAKRTLSGPKPNFDGIAPSVLKTLKGWDTMRRLEALNDAEKLIGLKKSDGKKLRRVTQITELDDANYSGTSQSTACTLIIVEGGSAATYPEILRDRIPGGRDTHGILLLRGKPLNVLKAGVDQLVANMVYSNFKQALGLQDGQDYSSSLNFKKLRYGHVLIATDADCDGWHILSLLLLMFHARFPSLVDRGYLSYLRTPVLRVPGAQGLTFYTKRAYLEWKAKAVESGGLQATMAKRKPKYYKGLGSSKEADVEEDLKSKRGRLAIQDDDHQAQEALDLAFNVKRTGHRKTWLSTPVQGEFLDTDAPSESIARFIHTGLKLYSLDNIQRAIPSVMDGMKEAMRKALCAGIRRFGLGTGDRHVSMSKEERKAAGIKSATFTVPPEAKVFQIIGYTTEHYCYHHGESILGEVIANMCKSYVGTNNVTWFEPMSSFGTIDSGKAPDPRYSSVGPAWWWPYAFHPADSELVEHIYDEDRKCEPRHMLPVVCWALCNHADGVGTGYSTKLPGHNIEEVALAHLCLLEGRKTFPKLLPWWRGFRGTVTLVARSKARKMVATENSVDVQDVEINDNIEEDSEEPTGALPDGEGMVCLIDGTYTLQGNTVIITALPLRTFKEFTAILAALIEKKIVNDYRNLSVGEKIRFEVEMVVDEAGKPPPGNIMKLFRLRRIITMTNLVLLDERGLPKRFRDSEDILNYFHVQRLEFYDRRRLGIIDTLQKKLLNLEHRKILINALISDDPKIKIEYEKRPKAEILAEISIKLPDVPHSIYGELEVRHLNEEELVKLDGQLEAAQGELNALQETTKEAMWREDLLAFLKEYRAIYGGVRNVSEPFKSLPW